MLTILLVAGLAARAQDDAPPPPPPEGDFFSTSETGPTATADEAPPPTAEQPPAQTSEAERAALLDDVDSFLSTGPPPPAPTGPAASANSLNPGISAFGDMLASMAIQRGEIDPDSGPWLRSFEMDIRADVDPYAKAVAVLAVEQEPPTETGLGEPQFGAAPEEAYIDLVALPAGFSARLGKFKLPFGIMNKMHSHDWPWPTAPLPYEQALGPEGLNDTGGVVSWRGPVPFGLTFEGGVVSGTTFDPQGETAAPAWLGRVEVFQDFGDVDVGLGASAHGLGPDHILGGDLMFRWKKDSWHSVVLVSEFFDRNGENTVSEEHAGQVGVTNTLQIQPTRPVYIGLRADWTPDQTRYAAYLSYYTTEFLRIRAGAETDDAFCEWLPTAQLTFVWGAHPVEPYWVNR